MIDLGESDHYFTDKSLFTSYTLYNSLDTDFSADRDFTFIISERESIQFLIEIIRVSQKVILNDALNTPNSCSNLISVSKIDLKGAQVSFIRDGIVITTLDNCPIMLATHFGQLYTVGILKFPLISLTVQFKWRAVGFDTWHQRLIYIGSICYNLKTLELVKKVNLRIDIHKRI